MLLALLAFRRGAPAVMLVLVLWWPGRVAASDLWQRPDQRAYQQMQQAAEAYRNGDFDDAAERYAQVEGADADYNRGNALAKAGHYPQAIEAYEEALRQDPGMEDAIANKRAVEAAMNRQPPQGPQSGQQDGDDDSQQPGDGQGSPGAGQPSGAGGDSDADDRAPPPEGRPDDAGADKPSERDSDTPPPDAEAQSAADAAQREQMRKALQDATQPPAEEGETPAEATETPEQRERRLANEAWLRRIPDDPGGLLREKFRLEHQRRQMQQGWEPR
jgi:Ca-activated chloride channel family protein